MSIDSVWEQKHAATSSIKSSPLLAGSIKMSEIAMGSFFLRGGDGVTTVTTYADGHIETRRIPSGILVTG